MNGSFDSPARARTTRHSVWRPGTWLAAVALAAAVVTTVGCAPQPSFQVQETPMARVGTVESIRQESRQRNSDAAGAIVGGLVGGGIGSLFGSGGGQVAATVVGAVGGGLVGSEIARNNQELVWQIGVRFDDGGFATITQTQAPGLRIGDRVRVTGSGLELLR